MSHLRRFNASRLNRLAPDSRARGAGWIASTIDTMGADTARRRNAVIGEICEVTARLRAVLPVALQFAALCGDPAMKVKLLNLEQSIDRFDAACGSCMPLGDLVSVLHRFESGVLEVTKSLDLVRKRYTASQSGKAPLLSAEVGERLKTPFVEDVRLAVREAGAW